MKRLIVFAGLFLALAVTARADSYVLVDFAPVTAFPLGNETVAANFVWDTTTNVISNVNITADGPWGTFSSYGVVFGDDPFGSRPAGITVFSVNSPGGVAALDDIFGGGPAPIPPTPGIYQGEVFFNCFLQTCIDNQLQSDTAPETITVSSYDAHVPEPGTLPLLAAGLGTLMFMLVKKS